MDEMNYSQFEYWQRQKNNEFPDIVGMNYTIDRLSEDTAFLWTSMSGAPPCSSSVGMWELALNIKSLAGYVRYIYLENFFEIWLKRDQWEISDAMIKAEDLFSKAESICGLEYKMDIPLMKEIIEEVDRVMELENHEIFEGLKRALNKFNARWNNTLTWSFAMNIYQDSVEAGKVLFDNNRDNIEEMYSEYLEEDAEHEKITKDQWLEICKDIYGDKGKLDLFLNIVRNSNYF
ncbi:MAG TPA: hypothetical protein VFC84_15725 [Desulfosporosinus sp.]|nr:hypothetical protein [Desulfosporosinus sp.]